MRLQYEGLLCMLTADEAASACPKLPLKLLASSGKRFPDECFTSSCQMGKWSSATCPADSPTWRANSQLVNG